MDRIGIRYYDVRDFEHPVTLNDLTTHNILIVGWNDTGNMGGLPPSNLAAGITGRIVLTGHDADYHTAFGRDEQPAAERFFAQAISFVLQDGGTGLVAMGDPSAGFSWLPAEWGIASFQNKGEIVTAFTPEGDYSGIFEGLTPGAMCDWGESYHNRFGGWGGYFAPFEKGGDDGQAVITIGSARQFGFHLEKDDGVGPNQSVLPNDAITYTIRFYSLQEVYNLDIVDTLSPAVTYDAMNWQTMTMDPAYNPNTHTYTWHIDYLPAYNPNDPAPYEVRTLTVKVNGTAEPKGEIVNKVEAIGPVYRYAEVRTPVDCYGGSVIFVDGDTAAGGSGTSWAMAYNDLQNALARAGRGCGNEIWVAKGTYKPGMNVTDTFKIPDRISTPGVSVYGGFAGNETARENRNWKINKTILSGYIGKDEFQNDLRNETVVTMGNNSLLDGVTEKDGYLRGILGKDVPSYTVSNCIVEDNQQIGIRSENSNATVKWSILRNNGWDGFYQRLNGTTLTIENCQIYQNQRNGIQVYQASATIFNNVIYRNGSAGTTYYGIHLNQLSSSATIRNNTLVDNKNEGIRLDGPNSPSVSNCILYANHADGGYVDYSGVWGMQYCCLTDANDLQRRATPTGHNGNLRGNPLFAYADRSFGNFHLKTDPEVLLASPCINAGSNTGVGTDEKDIDNAARIYNTIVDIGADEMDCTDVYHPLDWNADGVVNMEEFYSFSKAWLTHDPNDPHIPAGVDPNDLARWNPRCNLDGDYDIDLADLVVFARHENHNWLWTACWRTALQQMQMNGMMNSSTPTMGLQAASLDITPVLATQVEAPPKPIKEQILELKDNIQFLERIWLEDPSIRSEIDPTEWKRFMNEVYKSIFDIQRIDTKTIDTKEVER